MCQQPGLPAKWGGIVEEFAACWQAQEVGWASPTIAEAAVRWWAVPTLRGNSPVGLPKAARSTVPARSARDRRPNCDPSSPGPLLAASCVICSARWRPICRSCRSASANLNGRTPAWASASRGGKRRRSASAASISCDRRRESSQRRRHLRQQSVRLLARGNQPIELRKRFGGAAVGRGIDHVPRGAGPPAADVFAHQLDVDDSILANHSASLATS